jgi:hypothetical protein
MTEQHANMEKAKAHLAVLAAKAEKLGWQRKVAPGMVAAPDAFRELLKAPKGPAAPKLPSPPKGAAKA